MTEKSENLILGILAHVDAGKTTMAEGLLYHSGTLRTPGRVDHKDTFLDTFEMERASASQYSLSRRDSHGKTADIHYLIHLDMWIFRQRWNGHFRYWIMPYW